MSAPYIELEVEKVFTYPSGDAIKVLFEGQSHSIPCAAIHEDSTVWKGTTNGTNGILKVRESIALDKGMIGGSSSGKGFPLKRNKMPEMPELMSDEFLAAMQGKSEACSGTEHGWFLEDTFLCLGDEDEHDTILADLGGAGMSEADMLFIINAPSYVKALLQENARLRAWAKLAKKRFEARRKRRS